MDNNKRRIASLALFRNLYNEGRSDVMKILSEFAKGIVASKHLNGFTPTQIKENLKREYEFYIPESVVESVLKKFCSKKNSKYYVDNIDSSQTVSDQKILEIENSHELIISQLISYVEKKSLRSLEKGEKEQLIQSFYGFLLDEQDVSYADLISAFVIETQQNFQLSSLLRTIKEGVVLYTGIQYNDNINEVGSWKDELTIFVEQEILFHLAGYNGELYRQLFEDFYGLVEEVNRKARKQLIKVKYFDCVKIEIEKYFKTAERIVDGRETLDCSKIAMSTIVQGCESKSDVIAKKMAFFDLMEKKGISEKDGTGCFDEGSEYNIYYRENLDALLRDFPSLDVDWSLQLLNFISMMRRGSVSGFEKSKCILLTGNSTTMKVAFHPSIKKNGDVPLARTLDYVTNKLWFKLNKGFGNNCYPKSFSVVTKAQIILSSQIVGSVSREFEKIKQEITQGGKSEDVIIAELAELKSRVRKPEEVQAAETADILSTISMADTELYLREREIEKNLAQTQKEENLELLKEIDNVKREMTEIVLKTDETIRILEQKIEGEKKLLEESKNQALDHIDERILEIDNRKQKADGKVEKRVKCMRWVPWLVILLVVAVVILCGIWFECPHWNVVKWLISVLISILPYLFFAIGGKSWNPQTYIDVVYKEKCTRRLYQEYDVDLSKRDSLEEEKRKITLKN